MPKQSKVEEAILLALLKAEVRPGDGIIGYNFKLPDDALAEVKQALKALVLGAIGNITDYAETKCTNCEDGQVSEYDGEYYTSCHVCGGMGNTKVLTEDVIDAAIKELFS